MDAALPKLQQPLDWLGLSCRVPSDWEVVRHSLSPDIGKLVLVDRRRERLVLSWTQCQNRPDMQQLLRDYGDRAKSQSEGSIMLTQRRLAGDWIVLTERPEGASRALHHAVSYHRQTSRLIEAAIVTCSDEERPLVERLVDSVRVTAPAHESTRTRLFGVDLTAPADFCVVATSVKPADVSLTLEPRLPNAKHRARSARVTRVIVRRLGMAEAWSQDDLGTVLGMLDPKAEWARREPVSHRGHPALRAERPAPRFVPGTRREAMLWRCQKENALYLVTLEQPKRSDMTLDAFRVGCQEVMAA